MDLYRLYCRAPIFIQNAMATGFGVKERLLRYGGSYRDYLEELRAAQWFEPERLASIQAERLRAMVTFAQSQVPYYRDLFRSLGIDARDIRNKDDLAALPVLEKSTVVERSQEFRPEALDERTLPQTTGGTTGKPLRYWVTPSAMQYNYAAYEARFRNWAGVAFGDRMVSINGRPVVPIEQQQPPFWRFNAAFNQLYLSAYHLNDGNLPAYVDKLAAFAPRVMVGYASTIHSIARFIKETGRAGEVAPRAILVSSETLFDWIRSDIETAFGCAVFDGYGLGEMTALVTQCEQGSMHESVEYGVIEQVADLPDSEGTELVTTGLFNRGMPLLRYRTRDLVAPVDGKPCGCGRGLPVVGTILGRVDDRVVTPEGGTVGPAALSLAFQDAPNVVDAQIVQDSPRAIELRLVTRPSFSAADRRFLLEQLRTRLGMSLEIEIVRVDEIPRTQAGKQRLIVSNVRDPAGPLPPRGGAVAPDRSASATEAAR